MAYFRRWRFPVIVFTIQISDRSVCELFRRHIVQTTEIDRIELAPSRGAPNAKRANAAVLAKQMLVCLREKLVFCKFRLAGEQPERLRLHDGRPEPYLCAYGAVAPNGALHQVDVCFESNQAAMATALISLHLRSNHLRLHGLYQVVVYIATAAGPTTLDSHLERTKAIRPALKAADLRASTTGWGEKSPSE